MGTIAVLVVWIIEKSVSSAGIRNPDSIFRRLVTSDYPTNTVIFFVACSDPIVMKREGIVVSCRISFHYLSCMVNGISVKMCVSLCLLKGEPSVGCFYKPCKL